MSYSIHATANFEKEAKRLIKKYRSLKNELLELIGELETNPTKGISLGNDIYKIRISIKSKGKGKSGGARVMSYLQISENSVTLFSIFNKGERDSLSDKEIKELIKNI